MLEIKKLSKKYAEKHVLKDVNLTLTPGTISVLLGRSGGGKSTLLRILNNLETIDSGTISFDGKKLDLQTIHKQHLVGMVFQHFSLFKNLSVKQNITIVLEKVLNMNKKQAEEKAVELLKQFDLQDHAHQGVSSLSGGQQQRLALARTLSTNPKILCMDEPTSALDPLLTNYVADLINSLAHSGYCLLIATHDLSLVKNLDCTIHLMQHGAITQTATSKEFFADPEKYPLLRDFAGMR